MLKLILQWLKAGIMIGGEFKESELGSPNEKTRIVSMWEGKNGFDFLGYHNRMVKCKRLDGREYYYPDT
jgi:hypothetical protein